MANNKPGKNREALKQKVLFVAAKYFLEQGYTNTTLHQIAATAGVSGGSVTNLFGSKEDILCHLVTYVIEEQFRTTGKLLCGMTDDKLLFYAAETSLQLHIVEMNENLREVYSLAYSFPKSSGILQQTITGKLENIFKEHLPNLQTRDFYMLEIATGGIMRGFMTVPCDIWFTMDMKIEAFLRSVFKLYDVPTAKIDEAIDFVKKIDFAAIARDTVDGIVRYLDEMQKEIL